MVTCPPPEVGSPAGSAAGLIIDQHVYLCLQPLDIYRHTFYLCCGVSADPNKRWEQLEHLQPHGPAAYLHSVLLCHLATPKVTGCDSSSGTRGPDQGPCWLANSKAMVEIAAVDDQELTHLV